MYHPVKVPITAPPMILIQLIALVPALISPPLFAIAANLLPMKTCIINFGVTIAVATANITGCTVGMVEIAPLENEYGNGQSRIMTSNFNPSDLSVKVKAAKRVSLDTSR